MPNEDKNFGGPSVLDLKRSIQLCCVSVKESQTMTLGNQLKTNCNKIRKRSFIDPRCFFFVCEQFTTAFMEPGFSGQQNLLKIFQLGKLKHNAASIVFICTELSR